MKVGAGLNQLIQTYDAGYRLVFSVGLVTQASRLRDDGNVSCYMRRSSPNAIKPSKFIGAYFMQGSTTRCICCIVSNF